MNIYVGNLAFEVTEEDLRQSFEAYGDVTSAKIIRDRYSGGFGFVEMPDRTEAESAIAGLNDKELKGRTVRISEARPRSQGPRGGGRGGGDRGGRRPSW